MAKIMAAPREIELGMGSKVLMAAIMSSSLPRTEY
jgi:hypothetical protein